MFWRQLWIFVLTAGGIGLLAHFVGEALPRRWFHGEAKPFRPYAWEQSGAVYQKLGIQKWKTRLPDKSVVVKGCERKRIETDMSYGHFQRLVQETCVAETVHWALLIISPVLLAVMTPPYSVVFTLLYGLSNIPFIMIQRYNRPRLLRLCRRFQPVGEVDSEGIKAASGVGKEELA